MATNPLAEKVFLKWDPFSLLNRAVSHVQPSRCARWIVIPSILHCLWVRRLWLMGDAVQQHLKIPLCHPCSNMWRVCSVLCFWDGATTGIERGDYFRLPRSHGLHQNNVDILSLWRISRKYSTVGPFCFKLYQHPSLQTVGLESPDKPINNDKKPELPLTKLETQTPHFWLCNHQAI